MPIAPSMQRFVDDELTRSRGLVERTLDATVQALFDAKHPAAAAIERVQRDKLHDLLRRQAGSVVDGFVASLRRSVLEALHEQHDDSLPGLRSLPTRLALMDETRVEIDIEIARATQAINAEVEWEMRELQTFTSTLAGQTHVTAETNPLRPAMYATALWDATGELALSHAQRAALLRVSTDTLARLVKLALAAACTRLESQGIEPGLYRTAVVAQGAGRRHETQCLPARPLDLLTALQTGAPSSPHVPPDTADAPDHEAALRALDALAARLTDASSHAEDLPALRQRMDTQRAVVRASAVRSREAVDLVSRLFETMLSDSQLSPTTRAVLARLEVPTLRTAASDPELLQSYEHPAWQLVNRIGGLGEAYPQAGDPRLAALLPFYRRLIDQIAQSAQRPGDTLYGNHLARLDAFVAQQLRSQLTDAQVTIQALTRIEQRDLLEAQVSQRLASEIASVPTTPAMRRFVAGAWAQVLAESMLRFGEASEPTIAYLKLVDDLLWSLALPDHPQSRQRLVAMLPDLLKQLRRGMAMIALPQPEQQAVLDDLMAIHTEALRPGARGKASSKSGLDAADAAGIVRRMRNEVVPPAAGALPDGASVIDFASMQTVPAELLPCDPPDVDSPARQIDLMQAGGHYRLFLHGRWTHAQLLWRSPHARLFVFAGENAARPHSITRRALERLNEAGLARLHAESPLIRRTADALEKRSSRGG